LQCMVRYHRAVSLLGLLKRGQEPAARRICCRFLQRLPDMIEGSGPAACPAGSRFHVGNSRLRRKARAHPLANFTRLTHNLRGVVIWGNHECFRDSNRTARWWRDPGGRAVGVAGYRLCLYRRAAAGLHGRCVSLVRFGDSRRRAGRCVYGEAANRTERWLSGLLQG